MKRAPRASTIFGRSGRDEDHQQRRRDDRRAGLERRIARDVLQVLLADEHRAHERAEDDDAGAGPPPRTSAAPRCQGRTADPCARRWRMTKATPAATAMSARPRTSAPMFGTGAKLIARISVADEQRRQDAAQVVDRLDRLVDVRRHEPPGHEQRHHRERQRHEEHRAPLELLEEEAGHQRAERRDRAAERGPQRDRPGPCRARAPTGR